MKNNWRPLLGLVLLLVFESCVGAAVRVKVAQCNGICGEVIRDTYVPIIASDTFSNSERGDKSEFLTINSNTYILKCARGEEWHNLNKNDIWLSNPDFMPISKLKTLEPVGYVENESFWDKVPIATLIIIFFWGIGLLQMYLQTRKARAKNK